MAGWNVVASEGTWKLIAALCSLVGFASVVAVFTAHIFRMESRIEKLEAQIGLVAAAPAITRFYPSSAPDAKPRNDLEVYSDYSAVLNPLVATCVDLIKRAATAGEKLDISARLALESLMRDYDCRTVLKTK